MRVYARYVYQHCVCARACASMYACVCVKCMYHFVCPKYEDFPHTTRMYDWSHCLARAIRRLYDAMRMLEQSTPHIFVNFCPRKKKQLSLSLPVCV